MSTIKEVIDSFPNELQNPMLEFWGAVKESLGVKKEDFTETEIKYRKYKTNDAPELIFNGEEFYVARNWGIGNIHKLINKFTDKFPGLEYETN